MKPTRGRVLVKLTEDEELAMARPGDPATSLWVEVVAIGEPLDFPADFKVGDRVRLEQLLGTREVTEEGIYLSTSISNVILIDEKTESPQL